MSEKERTYEALKIRPRSIIEPFFIDAAKEYLRATQGIRPLVLYGATKQERKSMIEALRSIKEETLHLRRIETQEALETVDILYYESYSINMNHFRTNDDYWSLPDTVSSQAWKKAKEEVKRRKEQEYSNFLRR